MSEKVLIIDGHSMMNRAFYALPDLTNAEGKHTNAVLGFLNIMLKILDEEKPDYLAVAFDVHAPTFRHKMYDAYKGTRHPMPEELREQIPLIQDVLRAMGIQILMLEGYEADDIIGTVARASEAKGMDVTVLSGDRDLLQLATDKVMIRIPKTKGGQNMILDYHTQDVIDEYQITPAQVIELKALMGDSSDNIPGIPGVGVKTATKILQSFGSIENAHDHLSEIKPKKAMESLRDHWDMAVLSRDLATIHTDIPVELDYEKARVTDIFTPEAYQLFRKLGFKKLLTHFNRSASGQSEAPATRLIRSADEADQVISHAQNAREAGFYLLHSFEPHTRTPRIYGLAISVENEGTCYIPVSSEIPQAKVQEELERLAEGTCHLATYALKDQMKAVPLSEEDFIEPAPPSDTVPAADAKGAGVDAAVTGIFDIRIAAYLLDPLKTDYPYNSISSAYLPDPVLSPEEIFGSAKLPAPSEMEEEKAAQYAGAIADASLKVMGPMTEALKESGMYHLMTDIEMPLVFTLYDMETNGIRVLPEELADYGQKLADGITQLEVRIYQEAGETFNINSPKQLGVILFEKMGLPGGKKTKTGYSTSAEVLEKLAPGVPMVRDILEYRQLSKLKSTYADGLAGFISTDGRIHTTFRQTITATGRISSTDPNLQNIPIRIELGRQIRKVFVPEKDYIFIDADYSQIELRVLASMSGDEKLIDAYRQAKDIHRITASQVFHVPFDEVTPLMRRNAKAVNFGIVYGISAFGLSQDLGISRQEASDYIESYYETYPGIRSFLEGLVTSAKTKGYSVTMFGRRRPMPELKSGNFMQRSFGERVAKNAPIQGTAADIIKIAMNRVNRRLKREHLKSRLLVQVHDELLIEAAKGEEEIVKTILREEMEGAADLAVRLEIDVHDGASWYEAK
ncbi:MAG: DNA polymerase I [Bilifractor sp.]